MAFQALGGGLGAGDGAVEGGLVLGQGIDEEVGGRTGADADDAFLIQLGQNEVDGSLGDGLFELVLGHAGSERAGVRKLPIIAASASKTSVSLWSPDVALG